MSEPRTTLRTVLTLEVIFIAVSLFATAMFSSQFNRFGDWVIDGVKRCRSADLAAEAAQNAGGQRNLEKFLREKHKATECDTRRGAAAASTLALFYCHPSSKDRFDPKLAAQYRQIVERSSRATYIDQRIVYEACGPNHK